LSAAADTAGSDFGASDSGVAQPDATSRVSATMTKREQV
jgi:hypothetical protein